MAKPSRGQRPIITWRPTCLTLLLHACCSHHQRHEHAHPPMCQVLYVNLITSVTLGMMLANEPAEPDVMQRRPRRPGKRLLGKLILWRCAFVSGVLVLCVLGMYEWGNATGLSLARRRAEAFNTLVFGEIGYSVTTRFIKASTLHPRVFKGNPLVFICIGITAALQVALTYIPGLNAFFSMNEGMGGIQWVRVLVCMVVVYLVVELEKALVDPLLMPLVRPFLDFVDAHTPRCYHYTRKLKPRVPGSCKTGKAVATQSFVAPQQQHLPPAPAHQK